MKRPAEDGEEPPVKKLRTLQLTGHVAQEDQHVFISLQGSSEKVGKLFEGGHSVVFIRSGVATGKTTLAGAFGTSVSRQVRHGALHGCRKIRCLEGRHHRNHRESHGQ